MMNVNYLDIFLGIIFLALIIRCVIKGFVAEILSVGALLLGLVLGVLLSGVLAELLAQWLGQNFWNRIIAFLVLFLVGYIIVKILETSLQKLIDKMNLEKLDRVLGFFLGMVEGLLITGVILLIVRWSTIIPYIEEMNPLEGSVIARVLLPFLTSLLPVAGGAHV